MGLQPGDLASIRTVLSGFLPDTATITRTGVTVPARVADDKRDDRLEGLPHFIRLRRWRIVMPDAGQGWDADIRGGDTVTVTNGSTGLLRGTYYVLDTGNPKTYSVQTTAFCIQTKNAAGQIALPSNQTVGFRTPDRQHVITSTPVYIYQASADLLLFPDIAAYDWAVVFASDLTYPATSTTTPVRVNHQILWSQLEAEFATLFKPRTLLSPLGLTTAYFKQRGGP